MDIESELEALFREVLEIEGPFNREALKYNHFPKWNSLAHMCLVAAIETHFDCVLETEDILNLSNFEMAVKILEKYHVVT